MSKADLSNPIFHDEELACKWLEEQRWPDGPVCPFCKKRDRVTLRSKPSKTHPEGVIQQGWYHSNWVGRAYDAAAPKASSK